MKRTKTAYIFKVGKPERIASLAYSQGHSEEMLRKKYDKRKEEEKRRAAEKAVQEVCKKFLS